MSHQKIFAKSLYLEVKLHSNISIHYCPTMWQVVNAQQKERQKRRLSNDALYNIHEGAYDVEGFLKVIMTYPDLIVVYGHEEMLMH